MAISLAPGLYEEMYLEKKQFHVETAAEKEEYSWEEHPYDRIIHSPNKIFQTELRQLEHSKRNG